MPEILTESFCERCGTRYTFESAQPRVAPQGRQGPVARPEELRPVRRHVDRRGDGRRPERDGPRSHVPAARRLPQDVQLLHDVPPVHLRELLERGRGALPVLRAAPGSRHPAGALPRPGGLGRRVPRPDQRARTAMRTMPTLAAESGNGVDDVDAAARLSALTSPAPVIRCRCDLGGGRGRRRHRSRPRPSRPSRPWRRWSKSPMRSRPRRQIDAERRRADVDRRAEAADHDAADDRGRPPRLAALAAEAATSPDPQDRRPIEDIRPDGRACSGASAPARTSTPSSPPTNRTEAPPCAGAAATAPEAATTSEPTIEPDAEAGLPADIVAAGSSRPAIVAAEPEPERQSPSLRGRSGARRAEPEPTPAARRAGRRGPTPDRRRRRSSRPGSRRARPGPRGARRAAGERATVRSGVRDIRPVEPSRSGRPSPSGRRPARPGRRPPVPRPAGNAARRTRGPVGRLEPGGGCAAAPAAGKTASGVQPCVSCGLSLSATARFCRRCGTLQGG